MLYFRNEEIHELPENEKRALGQPFSHFVIFQFFCILSRKTPNYHGNYVTNWFFFVNSMALFFKNRSTSGFFGQEKPESNSASAGSPASSSFPNAKYSRILTKETYRFPAFSFSFIFIFRSRIISLNSDSPFISLAATGI